MGAGSCVAGGSIGMILGTLTGASSGAVLGALSGATGAAILKSAGWDGYSPAGAAASGAAGTAVMGTLAGCCIGTLAGSLIPSFFGNNKDDDTGKKGGAVGCGALIPLVGLQTLGGMLGWAMINDHSAETGMTLGTTAAALATGSAVIVPSLLMFACYCYCFIAIIGAALCGNDDKGIHQDIENDAKETAALKV